MSAYRHHGSTLVVALETQVHAYMYVLGGYQLCAFVHFILYLRLIFLGGIVECVLPSLVLLSQLLQGALSSFLETAKELATEQQRADEAKTTEHIDGRKDVQELVERNAARVRQRGAVGEASAMSAAGFGVSGLHGSKL